MARRRSFRNDPLRRLLVASVVAGCALMLCVLSGLALGRFTTAGMNRYSTTAGYVGAGGKRYEMVYDASDDIFASPSSRAPVNGRIVRARQGYVPASELNY